MGFSAINLRFLGYWETTFWTSHFGVNVWPAILQAFACRRHERGQCCLSDCNGGREGLSDVREPDFLPYLSGKITKNLGMKPTSTHGEQKIINNMRMIEDVTGCSGNPPIYGYIMGKLMNGWTGVFLKLSNEPILWRTLDPPLTNPLTWMIIFTWPCLRLRGWEAMVDRSSK